MRLKLRLTTTLVVDVKLELLLHIFLLCYKSQTDRKLEVRLLTFQWGCLDDVCYLQR